jgi:serine/threonine-protein kinase
MKLEPGQRIDRYTVQQVLGHGGMSDVFLAHDDTDQRDVVLKFPHEEILGDPKSYEHFCREVKIGQMLSHPNIQKLYALGGEGTSPFLILEYVPGKTLREMLNDRLDRACVASDIPFAISLGIQIATALEYAHQNHIAHRDMKPENILVMPDGTAKVMDFGIAFVEGARRVTWGMLSHQIGTPDYMAPEQIKGVRGDHRTDIYALGMILYENIAGRLPYEGDNALAIMNQHVTMKPPLIHDFCKSVPPAVEEIIMKAIRRNPADRWQTMQAFADALAHPDQVDFTALRTEREQEAGDTPAKPGLLGELGIPLWQAVLIVVLVLIVLAALGIIAQLLHSRHA